jgi:hypothetical protein
MIPQNKIKEYFIWSSEDLFFPTDFLFEATDCFALKLYLSL